MFEAEVLATWKAQVEAMALTHNTNADIYFKNACDYWRNQAEFRRANGLSIPEKPVHLPVCTAGLDAVTNFPVLLWSPSNATCPDLMEPNLPQPGITAIGPLISDGSGRRQVEAIDTQPKGFKVVKDGITYIKTVINTPFGPAKTYVPIG